MLRKDANQLSCLYIKNMDASMLTDWCCITVTVMNVLVHRGLELRLSFWSLSFGGFRWLPVLVLLFSREIAAWSQTDDPSWVVTPQYAMVLCNDANQLSFYYSWRWLGCIEAHWLILHHDDSDEYPVASNLRVEIQLLLTLLWRLTAAACFGASLLSWDRCMKSNRWSILGRDPSMKRWGPANANQLSCFHI